MEGRYPFLENELKFPGTYPLSPSLTTLFRVYTIFHFPLSYLLFIKNYKYHTFHYSTITYIDVFKTNTDVSKTLVTLLQAQTLAMTLQCLENCNVQGDKIILSRWVGAELKFVKLKYQKQSMFRTTQSMYQ